MWNRNFALIYSATVIAVFFAILAVLVLVPSSVASAPARCDVREKVLAHLETNFGEIVAIRGVSSNGGLLEVTVNRERGSWTIVVTAPGGPACLALFGGAWQDLRDPDPGPST